MVKVKSKALPPPAGLLFVSLILVVGACRSGEPRPSVVIEPGNTNQYRHVTTAPARINIQHDRQVSHRDAILQVVFYGQVVERVAPGGLVPVRGASFASENDRVLAFSERDWKTNPVISDADGFFKCLIPVMGVREQAVSGEWVLVQTSTTPIRVSAPGYEATLVLVRFEQPKTIVVLKRSTW